MLGSSRSFVNSIREPNIPAPQQVRLDPGFSSAVRNLYDMKRTRLNNISAAERQAAQAKAAMDRAKLQKEAADTRAAAARALQEKRLNYDIEKDKKAEQAEKDKNQAFIESIGKIYEPVDFVTQTKKEVVDKDNIVGQEHQDQKAADFWTSPKGQAIVNKIKPLQYKEDEQYRDLYTQYANLGSKYKNKSELQDAQNKFIEQHPKMFGLKGDEFDRWKKSSVIDSVADSLGTWENDVMKYTSRAYHKLNPFETKGDTEYNIKQSDEFWTRNNIVPDNPYEQARKRVNILGKHLQQNNTVNELNKNIEQEVNTIEDKFYSPVYGKKTVTKPMIMSKKDYYNNLNSKYQPIFESIKSDPNLNIYQRTAQLTAAQKAYNRDINNYQAAVQNIKAKAAKVAEDKKKMSEFAAKEKIKFSYDDLLDIRKKNRQLDNDIAKLEYKKQNGTITEKEKLELDNLRQTYKNNQAREKLIQAQTAKANRSK